MDPEQLTNTGNIPPQALQALQQQAGPGMDLTAILAQLAQMSPDQVATALQQLGVQVDADTLEAAASNWVDQAASKAAGVPEEGAEGATPEEAPPAVDEGEAPSAPTMPDDEAAEGESSAIADGVPLRGGDAMAMMRGKPSGPPPTAGAGGGMDELISAAMMQQAAGDPNAAVPNAAPPMPSAPPSAPPAGGGARGMIEQIYKDKSAKAAAGDKTGKRSSEAAPPQGRRRNA